jgi:hypothetical protein
MADEVVYGPKESNSEVDYLQKGSCGKWFSGYGIPHSESTYSYGINDPGQG